MFWSSKHKDFILSLSFIAVVCVPFLWFCFLAHQYFSEIFALSFNDLCILERVCVVWPKCHIGYFPVIWILSGHFMGCYIVCSQIDNLIQYYYGFYIHHVLTHTIPYSIGIFDKYFRFECEKMMSQRERERKLIQSQQHHTVHSKHQMSNT